MIFILDIVVNFRTGYVTADFHENEVELDPWRSARNYMRTWFALDGQSLSRRRIASVRHVTCADLAARLFHSWAGSPVVSGIPWDVLRFNSLSNLRAMKLLKVSLQTPVLSLSTTMCFA